MEQLESEHFHLLRRFPLSPLVKHLNLWFEEIKGRSTKELIGYTAMALALAFALDFFKSLLASDWFCFCNPTSNWPYRGHQVPYLVPRTTDCLTPLWSNTQHWSYAPGVCSGTGMLWRILRSWLIEYPLRDNSRDMHSGIPARSGILLSDITQLTTPQTWTI